MSTQNRSLKGNIGNAMTFDGDTNNESGDHIVLADIDYGPDDAITVSAWARTSEASQPGAGNQGYIVSKHKYTGDSPYTLEVGDDTHAALYFNGDKCDFETALNDGQWHHLVGVRYEDRAILYVDGVERCSREDLDSGDEDTPAAIGSHPDRAEYRPFKGDIDEVRISRVDRSADWVKLCYENQRPNQTLVKLANGGPTNIISNGSFEDGIYSPDFWAWDAWQFTSDFIWDDTEARGCGKSVRIDAPEANDAAWIQTVDVEPNKNYCLSGWIKTDNVGHTLELVDAGANLSLYGSWTRSEGVFGTNDWTYRSFLFNSGDNDEITIGARLGYWAGTTTGTAWFDDLQLKPIVNPSWKILVLIYQEVDFEVTDDTGYHHYKSSMTRDQMDLAAERARQFVEIDIPALTSGYMVPEITVRYPERKLTKLSNFKYYGDNWWPALQDTAQERDPSFDSVIVIWESRVTDQDTGDIININGRFGGLTLPRGSDQTYSTMLLSMVINSDTRNVFKHEWGHSIQFYFDAMGLSPKPMVNADAPVDYYVNCNGEYDYPYEFNERLQRWEWVVDPSVPHAHYNNESGFTHDYYSGTTALAENPTECLGIGPEAWAQGGPVSKPGNMCAD